LIFRKSIFGKSKKKGGDEREREIEKRCQNENEEAKQTLFISFYLFAFLVLLEAVHV